MKLSKNLNQYMQVMISPTETTVAAHLIDLVRRITMLILVSLCLIARSLQKRKKLIARYTSSILFLE